MKHASITLVVLALFTPAAFAACASGAETTGGVGGGGVGGESTTGATMTTTTGTGSDPTTTTGSSGTTTTTGGGNMCVPHCTSDQSCQTSCPTAGSSLNCCDLSTGMCYVTGATVCPAPKPDAGMTMPPY